MLSVNIDHIATLRQARRESFPDPVQAAALVELGGADGITVHLRQDRRHINDRDVDLLKQTLSTELTVEMAATEEMVRMAERIRPSQVTLVPEVGTEITTTSGLDLTKASAREKRFARRLKQAGIRLSIFVDAVPDKVEAAAAVGADVVELNTDRYNKDVAHRPASLERLVRASACASEHGLAVHVGHGLDYLNVVPIIEKNVATGFSIGFAIVARAVMVGLREAVAEMKRILEVYS